MSPTLPTSSDFPRLLASAKSGDADALNQLCDRIYPRVNRVVHHSLATDFRARHPWLGAMFSTGDIVQEVFLGALKNLDGFEGDEEERFIQYLAVLTKNRLIDSIRFYEATRRDRRRNESNGAVADQVCENRSGPEEQAIALEEIGRVHQALMTFGERDRTLLRERFENKTRFDQLSQTLGYASADSARKAFAVAQAKLALRIGRLRKS